LTTAPPSAGVLHLALLAQAQPGRQFLTGNPTSQDRARRHFGVQRHRREAAEQAADVGHHVLALLAARAVHRHVAMGQVDQRVGARALHEGARHQLVQQVIFQTLAFAAAGLAPFLLFDLFQLARQQVVDHRARQDLVLTAHRQPQRIADAVREHGLLFAAERGNETARIHFERANRLEQYLRQQGVDFGEIRGGREAEQRQVAKEHGIPE
jgi:hypothetical protein